MATEEIEISELEFREELSGDDLIPVETSTNTFATSLTKIKDWLKSFFVSKTENESIYGYKTFDETIYRRVKGLDIKTIPSSNKYLDWLSPKDENDVSIGFFGTTQRADGSHHSRLGVTKYINGTGIYQELDVGIDMEGNAYSNAPNPKDSSNTNNIATTSWTRRNIKCIPNYSAQITLTKNADTTITTDGIIYGTWNTDSNASLRSKLTINGHLIATGSTSATMNALSSYCFPVAKGDIVKFTGNTAIYFAPMKGVSL